MWLLPRGGGNEEDLALHHDERPVPLVPALTIQEAISQANEQLVDNFVYSRISTGYDLDTIWYGIHKIDVF